MTNSFFVALGSFVEEVVHIYYDCDKTLLEDEEIQAFVKDVCSFGMQDFDHCGENKLFTVLYCHVLEYSSLQIHTSYNHGSEPDVLFIWTCFIYVSIEIMYNAMVTEAYLYNA